MEVLTEKQWLTRGRIPRPDTEGHRIRLVAYGSVRYHTYFSLHETVSDAKTAAKRLKELKQRYRATAKANKAARKKEAEEIKQAIAKAREAEDKEWDFWEHCHTAWQWIQLGKVPKPDAKWMRGPGEWDSFERDGENIPYLSNNYEKSPDYFYCHESDTAYSPEEAKDLLDAYNQMLKKFELPEPPPLTFYDGRPWWTLKFMQTKTPRQPQ